MTADDPLGISMNNDALKGTTHDTVWGRDRQFLPQKQRSLAKLETVRAPVDRFALPVIAGALTSASSKSHFS